MQPPIPPKKSNRGVLISVIGGVVAVAIIAIIAIIATRPGPQPTPTPTPVNGTSVAVVSPTPNSGASATSVVASSTATAAATATTTTVSSPVTTATVTRAASSPVVTSTIPSTRVVLSTATPTRGAASASPTQTGQSETVFTAWTDPGNLVRLQLPKAWKQTKIADDNSNLIELDGPENVYFWLFFYDPQQGSIMDELGFVRQNQDASTEFTYSNQKITDTTIAGQPAKTMTYDFVSKSDATSKGDGQWWIVNVGGKEFAFKSNNNGNHQKDLNAIINSAVFATNGSFASRVWTDPKGIVRITHPDAWKETIDSSFQGNFLELDGPNDTYFYVDIFDGSKTLDAEINEYLTGHKNNQKISYTDGPVSDLKIGGEAAKTFSFTYAQKATPTDTMTGQIWIVNHGGKEYVLTVDNATPQQQAAIDAIVASLVFL
jgi:hypothetical protein